MLNQNHCAFAFFVINDRLILGVSSGAALACEALHLSPKTNLAIGNPISAQEQLNNLRKHMGFNISELARIIQVKRPSIYEWLELKSPNPKNQERLDLIYSFYQYWKEKDVGKIGQYMYRKITQDGRSLMDLLEEDNIDETQVNETLDIIAASLLKVAKENAARDVLLESKGFKPISKDEQRSRLMKLTRKIS